MCNDIKCKFCGSNNVNKRGKQKYNGKQRYLCRKCGKIWTGGNDDRIKYSDEKREKVIKMYLENVSIRAIERLEGVSEPLILKWIKKMGKDIKNKFNESINKIKDNIDNIDNIDEKDIKKENIEILKIDEIVTYVKKNLKITERTMETAMGTTMDKTTIEKKKKEKETSSTYGLLLIGTKIALLDLKSEIEQKEHIENYLKK